MAALGFVHGHIYMFKGKSTWLMVSLYCNSVAIGVILMWMFSAGGWSSSDDSAAENASNAALDIDELLEKENNENLPLRYTVKNGDRKFQMAEFGEAILHYQGVAGDKNQNETVIYRIGLALEATARFGKATEVYSSLSQNSKRPYIQRSAELGLARVFQKTGQQTESRAALWKLFLSRPTVESNKKSNVGFIGDAAHLLAMSYANKITKRTSRITTDTNISVHADIPFDPQFYLLDLLEKTGATDPFPFVRTSDSPPEKEIAKELLISPKADERENGRLDLRTVGEAFEAKGQMVYVRAKQVGLAEIFKTLETVLSTKIEFTESALDAIEFRSQDLRLDEIDLATLLHGLLAPLNLYWIESNEVFQIASKLDLTAEQIELLDQERAVHLLRYTVFDFPDNRLLAMTQFIFGNLSFQKQEWTTSIANYREALKSRNLISFVRQRAAFNLGKSYLKNGEIDSAEKAFFQASDESFGGDLSAAALIMIARQHAIDGKYSSGIRNASHAIVAATSDTFRAEAAILQSSIYLLDGQYFAANQAIMDNRESIVNSNMTSTATFMSAYARYFAQPIHGNEESEDLLRTLNILEPTHSKLPHLPLLLGIARRTLGFHQDAIKGLLPVFEKESPSDLREKMKLELSREFIDARQLPDEMLRYERILMADSGETTSVSQMFRNAKSEFDAKNYENCKRICESILKKPIYADMKNRTLKLIGQAYERTGDHHTAATYFAGLYDRK